MPRQLDLRRKYLLHLPLICAMYQGGQRAHRLRSVQFCLLQMECYRNQDERESERRNHAQSISREKDEYRGCNARHSKQQSWDHCLQNGIRLNLLKFWRYSVSFMTSLSYG